MEFNVAIVGYTAGVCSAICQFPQAYKVFKTKDTHSISLGMYLTMTIGVILWFTYGVLIEDMPMMLANGVGLVPSFYTLYVTIRNSKSKNNLNNDITK
ncbi:SemiSWEET transporter [Paludibacter sp.]|uniref:SemiSWEET family sugar transporter n=1 Tax=Paludibacter sp. TaxID=1898105 RepID=UPI001352E0A5|nr:SemiSWEET transporter [Paludibacter sp.]MTK52731.1 glutathione synthetase [Paludibacter sp.]